MKRAGAALVALALGCGRPSAPPPDTCEDLGVHTAEATPPERRLLGQASPYPDDPMLPARLEELRRSQRARREAAWSIVARVLEPVALAEPVPAADATLPRFRTWYDREDLRRVFQHAFSALPREARIAHERLAPSALDEAFAWNPDAIDTVPEWTETRWNDYVASLSDELAVRGIGGIRRIATSPAATRHLAHSYPEILRCLVEPPPPALAAGSTGTRQVLAQHPLALGRCAASTFGPFVVAEGGSLRALVTGEGGERGEGATLEILAGPSAPSASPIASGPADAPLTATGAGIYYVRVTAAAAALGGTLEVALETSELPPACLDGPFPRGSASVAAEWRRIEPGLDLPTFDTSAAALRARLGATGDASWGDGDGALTPDLSRVYALPAPDGGYFVLAGLHIRTRELPHWMNITLWFSDRPDEDFGEDRPDAIRALGGPWSNYKMCVAIDHLEADPDPQGGFAQDAPSLAAALASVHEGQGGPSWCSNPYIDAGPGLSRSNCVGCHQHAMSGARSAEIATDEARFPEHGRLLMRNNFPADGFWGLDAGDHLASELSVIAEWWSEAP